jgi:hypothetical protein
MLPPPPTHPSFHAATTSFHSNRNIGLLRIKSQNLFARKKKNNTLIST